MELAAAQAPSLRVPPQNIEAEQSVLGGVLLENNALNEIVDALDVEDFYRTAHQKIYAAMLDLYDRREPVDLITLTEYLRRKNELEEVGGATYLAGLSSATPTAANIGHYARIIRESAVLRRLIQTSTDIVQRCYSHDRDVDHLLDDAERVIFDISAQKIKQGLSAMPDLIKTAFKKIEKLCEAKGQITGVPTGFKDFDHITSGLQSSDLVIIAGRPSMGKTAFCLNVAQYAAIRNKLSVLLFSLEMSEIQLVMRMLCSEAGIDSSRMRGGMLNEEDWPRLTRAAGLLSEAKIFIDDSASPTVLEMKAKARRLKAEHDLGLIMIDYLQLVRGSVRSERESREREISDISRGLKALAKELEVPVLALSQLNRGVETRTNKRPILSDLRESGAIEQDADVIVFIYRDEFYNPDSPDKNVVEIIVGKQRNGPVGTVKLFFNSQCTKFGDLLRTE